MRIHRRLRELNEGRCLPLERGAISLLMQMVWTLRHPITGVCRTCGCTDDWCIDCIAVSGAPCHWADEAHTLCSVCAATPELRERGISMNETTPETPGN